ncbi:hypothetical protein [Photobacterium lipolyticum]|uniref:DUF4105 domain-containing protein n=1 Tax=Photobacterium lipolyticum TaxID=266810 RepID=A0A2T3MS28_9GAMM|nr:hypothetical protein [Photobacterium lipolyticum]PSW00134.1 hypothetical protein C9I89_21440 [Photobacterium lipolyticum]
MKGLLVLLLIFVIPPLFAVDQQGTATQPSVRRKQDISLPFNEYYALALLAKWRVSSIELPQHTDFFNDIDGNDIYGADLNNNQIRDDYEKMLLSSYERPEYVVMGILATKKWNILFDVYTNNVQIHTLQQAKTIFIDNIAINRCYYDLQQIDRHLASPILAYFNTDDRLNAKRLAEEQLLAAIGENHHTLVFHNQPCEIFSELLKVALNSEQALAFR